MVIYIVRKFSDFAADEEHLDGKKMPFSELVGKQIVVWNSRILQSQYDSESCVMLQFSFEEEGEKFVAFTASKVIIEQIGKYKAQMPFETKIEQRKSGKHFYYTLT